MTPDTMTQDRSEHRSQREREKTLLEAEQQVKHDRKIAKTKLNAGEWSYEMALTWFRTGVEDYLLDVRNQLNTQTLHETYWRPGKSVKDAECEIIGQQTLYPPEGITGQSKTYTFQGLGSIVHADDPLFARYKKTDVLPGGSTQKQWITVTEPINMEILTNAMVIAREALEKAGVSDGGVL